jgi:hypothetical protein
MIISTCKESDSHIDFFNDVTIEGDSINLILKMRESQEIATSKGTISIFFEASEFCARIMCPTCDVEASIRLFLVHENDTVKLPTISIYRCGEDPPIIYRTVSCSQEDSGYNFIKYGKLIYCIKEMFPYPETIDEIIDLVQNNKYYIKLTIIKAC